MWKIKQHFRDEVKVYLNITTWNRLKAAADRAPKKSENNAWGLGEAAALAEVSRGQHPSGQAFLRILGLDSLQEGRRAVLSPAGESSMIKGLEARRDPCALGIVGAAHWLEQRVSIRGRGGKHVRTHGPAFSALIRLLGSDGVHSSGRLVWALALGSVAWRYLPCAAICAEPVTSSARGKTDWTVSLGFHPFKAWAWVRASEWVGVWESESLRAEAFGEGEWRALRGLPTVWGDLGLASRPHSGVPGPSTSLWLAFHSLKCLVPHGNVSSLPSPLCHTVLLSHSLIFCTQRHTHNYYQISLWNLNS